MRNKTKIISGNAGFTLIELIVVIAIIAILGGIGTVGYSAYVDRANRGADEQMISDIEQALILGAYAKQYAPGSAVGAVAVSKGSDATDSADDWDGNGSNDVEEMMINAFGANWREELQLKSDYFGSSDSAAVWKAIQNAEKADGTNIFDSVPNSSFYAQTGNTDALVADVDEIASALNGVLDGVGYAFSNFWGTDFHNSVKQGGLTGEEWKSDPQMAANLTVFAAANQITGADEAKLNAWVSSWTGEPVDVTANPNGYVADLVMQYAQCVAVYNYVQNTGNNRDKSSIESYYNQLETAMHAL